MRRQHLAGWAEALEFESCCSLSPHRKVWPLSGNVRRKQGSAVRRAWLYSFFLTLPGLIFVGFLLNQEQVTPGPAILAICCLLLYLVLIAASLIEGLIIRPLQTLSNVVSSLREGDYSFRAPAVPEPQTLTPNLPARSTPLLTCCRNSVVRSLEATALLARILEVMHSPLYAFDRYADNVLQLVNEAARSTSRPSSCALLRSHRSRAQPRCAPRFSRPERSLLRYQAQSLAAPQSSLPPGRRSARTPASRRRQPAAARRGASCMEAPHSSARSRTF